MDPKEEDLLINLASMSRKRWLTFTTFKTRWYDPKSEICFTYTRILLFLRNILQKSSKNNETIARFSLLCSHWKFSLLNLRNLRRIIETCCDKIGRRSKLAWSEMVIFRLRIFALQLELCSGLWTFATYKHLAEWRLKHTWVDEMNSDEVIVSKYLQSVWFDADQSALSDLSAWLRVSLEVAPSSSSSHLLWYSADGSKCINFSVEKFSFGSPNFTFHLE